MIIMAKKPKTLKTGNLKAGTFKPKVFKPKIFKPKIFKPKVFKPETFNPDIFKHKGLTHEHDFGTPVKVPHVKLAGGNLHFSTTHKNGIVSNRAHNKKIIKERKAKVRELNKAYKRYDKALNNFNGWRNKFIEASEKFKKVDPEVAVMLRARARSPRGAIKTQNPAGIARASAKLSFGSQAMEREYIGNDTTLDIPYKFSPIFFENVLKKQAAKVAGLELKKTKRGNLVPDYEGFSDAEKKKKQRAYRNALRRNPKLPLSKVAEVMDLWHKTYPWASVESNDVYNSYLIVTDKKTDKNSQSGELDNDTLQKMYKLLIGNF